MQSSNPNSPEPHGNPTTGRNSNCVSFGRIHQIILCRVLFGVKVPNSGPNNKEIVTMKVERMGLHCEKIGVSRVPCLVPTAKVGSDWRTSVIERSWRAVWEICGKYSLGVEIMILKQPNLGHHKCDIV